MPPSTTTIVIVIIILFVILSCCCSSSILVYSLTSKTSTSSVPASDSSDDSDNSDQTQVPDSQPTPAPTSITPEQPLEFETTYPEEAAPEEAPEKDKDKNKNVVIVYKKSNYKVPLAKLKPGKYNLKGKDLKDTISSLKIPKGLKVQLFDKNDFKGDLGTYSKDVAQLPDKANSKAASIIVKKS